MATLRDISKLSGYSVTTVSRALNGYSDVNEETRAHIQKIADENGYSPNVLAKGLVSKDSKTFGFITSNFSESTLMDNFTFKLFMMSIERANSLGYEIVMIHYDNEFHKNKTFKQLISERNLSGAIIQGFDKDDKLCQEAFKSKVPTVFIDIGLCNETSGYIVSDIKTATVVGVEYLLNCGYRNLVFVYGSEESWVTDRWKEEMALTYKKYKDQIQSFHVLNGHYELELAAALVSTHSELFEREKTAVFCASDLMGIGIIRGVQKLGKQIPKDIGILGYDGMIVSQYITPPLSTVAQNPGKLGAGAVDLLLDIMHKKNRGTTHISKDIEVELIIRESTGEISNA